MNFRGLQNTSLLRTTLLVLSGLVFQAHAITDGETLEKNARKKLAQKLMKISKSVSVKEARYPDSRGGGSKDFDANTGNPFTSNTTYHSYVWDYCLQWAGNRNCERWLDPYVSEHGLEAGEDKSPLETMVAKLWQQMKKQGDNGAGGSYGIWNVQSKSGTVLDDKGRLDRTQLTKFSLKDEVKKKAEEIGYDTANKTISTTYNEDAQKNEMPNMESLRLMAGRFTRMFRNRMVASLGELRAADKGIEFTLGEDAPDCDSYLQILKNTKEEFRREDRVEPQAELDYETQANQLEKRYQLCMQARNASVYMVNAKAENGEIVSGGKEGEQIDKWRARVNIATIDYGGIDPNKVPKPSDQQLTEDETKSIVGQWNDGGVAMETEKISNAEQMKQYNQQLREAAQGMKEVAARNPFMPDASQQILENQIEVGTKSLVELNGLTKEMKLELQDTEMPRVGGQGGSPGGNPDRNLEEAPSQLTFSSAQ